MPSIVNLEDRLTEARLVSTDVFDTLLLRDLRAERCRILLAERAFAALLADGGIRMSPDELAEARLRVQRMAYKCIDVGGTAWDLRLEDILDRQMCLVGLAPEWASVRAKIELDIEHRSVSASRRIGEILRRQRLAGKRILAISDTALPAAAVEALIAAHHGPGLVDAVYTSADLRRTKREGSLFARVLEVERSDADALLHLGDDPVADGRSALRAGLKAALIPRHPALTLLRRSNGALAEFLRARRRRRSFRQTPPAAYTDQATFAQAVLGPISAHFAQQIWLYAKQAEEQEGAVMLFCARGGVGIRAVFEAVCDRLGLALSIRRENLMVSRLVAARAAAAMPGPELAEELQREFEGDSFADVAQALGGRPYTIGRERQRKFCGSELEAFLAGPSGVQVRADIAVQNRLFIEHMTAVVGDAQRIILCDTGLYGSTQRLLSAAFPHLRFETIQFDRANYKGHGEEHSPKVAGLVFERNGYSYFHDRSCILQYWHHAEAMFEPKVPSVRTFASASCGAVEANCGDVRFSPSYDYSANPLLQGCLDYAATLRPGDGLDVRCAADAAWSRLRRAVTSPSSVDLRFMVSGARSVDFGRDEEVHVIGEPAGQEFFSRLQRVRYELWREGWIAAQFPVLRHLLLSAVGGGAIDPRAGQKSSAPPDRPDGCPAKSEREDEHA